MRLWELIVLAVGLSMDAFAVAVCKGLSMPKTTAKNAVIVGLYFGLFQAGMPLAGYVLGSRFSQYIANFDHWIAFVLLVLIGLEMIRASREAEASVTPSLKFTEMILLALATSIDALAVGVTFAFLQVKIIFAVALIGCITFGLSAIGVKLGNAVGLRYRAKAELFGGTILILMGVKILVEHLFF